MSALNNIQARFNSVKGTNIEVPEWGDDKGPLKIFFNPLTAYNAKEISAKPNAGDPTINVDIVIMRALDASGNPAFADTAEVRHILLHETEAHVLARVAAQLMGQASDPELEKNS